MPAPSSDPNRIYLTVPFAEKDDAKRHGARWDPERKRWWIDPAKIATQPGITRWLTADPAGTTVTAAAAPARRPAATAAAGTARPAAKAARVDAATSFLLPACHCPSAPWDDCEHTRSAS